MPDRPWMEAIEMQFAALRGAQAVPAPTYDPHAIGLSALRHAATYAWSPEITAAVATAAASIPDTSVLSDITLSEASGFWWFGSCVPGCRFNALLWDVYPWLDVERERRDVCFTVFFPISDSDRRTRTSVGPFVWQIGMSLTDAASAVMTLRQTAEKLEMVPAYDYSIGGFTEAECRTLFRFFRAGVQWLEQRILVTTEGHIERHRRKQLAREHHVPPPNDVKIIELRRRESVRSGPAPTDGTPVEWSCQWVVSGHWTHQAHGPKHGERRLQYILPYVKGPDDKPLRVPSHTVYQVDR